MRSVIQRVSAARVEVAGQTVGAIEHGLLIFLGVGDGDTETDLQYMVEKTVNLRIFEDTEGKMNRSLLEVGAAALVVSQFTLYGDCRKGRRPSFSKSAPPDLGERLYQQFAQALAGYGIEVATGEFGAYMKVELVNDGPVTILLDSDRQF